MDRAMLMVAVGTGIVIAFLFTLLAGDLKQDLAGNLVAAALGAVAGWGIGRPPFFKPLPGAAMMLSIALSAIGALVFIALHRLT